MKRVFLLADRVEDAERVVADLRSRGIDETDIHALARGDMPLKEVDEPAIMDRRDVMPAMKRGVAAGGAAGLLAGVAAVSFPPAGVAVGGGALLASVAAGAGIGGWVSALVGSSMPNSDIRRFEEAVKQGRVLLLVDVPRADVEELRRQLERNHPSVEFAGETRTLPTLD